MSDPAAGPPPESEGADDERRAYASPVCYAHEFEALEVARAGPFELHRAIVEQSPDAVVVADRDGTIRLWNHAAQRLFGFSAAEALGTSLDLIVPERLRSAHWAGFRRAVEAGRLHGTPDARLTRAQHKDGRRLYVEFSFGLVRHGDGTVMGALAIGRDATARHAAANAPRPREQPTTPDGR
ncbi:MAG TPA: PAS domain S-box protein [Burkholderiaceae bacterium]|nr:PAS domain S-box protein [Burkholderiaceae bacterium]